MSLFSNISKTNSFQDHIPHLQLKILYIKIFAFLRSFLTTRYIRNLENHLHWNNKIQIQDAIDNQQYTDTINKVDLKKLFQFATSDTHFMFGGKFYNEINGVTIRSPLSLFLANLFMGYYEQNWIQSFKESELILYRRCMADIICFFNNQF